MPLSKSAKKLNRKKNLDGNFFFRSQSDAGKEAEKIGIKRNRSVTYAK